MIGHDYAHCADYDEATCPQICFRGQLVRDYRDRVHTDMQGVPVSWMHLRGTTECAGVHNIATHVPIRVRTNGEYISREDVVRAVAATNPHFSDRLLIIEKIREIPAADVRPVVRGRWIEKPYLIGTSRFCSKCGSNYGMPHEIYNYCPNCGTDMRKEDEDEDRAT